MKTATEVTVKVDYKGTTYSSDSRILEDIEVEKLVKRIKAVQDGHNVGFELLSSSGNGAVIGRQTVTNYFPHEVIQKSVIRVIERTVEI